MGVETEDMNMPFINAKVTVKMSEEKKKMTLEQAKERLDISVFDYAYGAIQERYKNKDTENSVQIFSQAVSGNLEMKRTRDLNQRLDKPFSFPTSFLHWL